MSRSSKPPRLPLRFFRWFCHPDYVEDIEGDLLERFEKRVRDKGVRNARRWFVMEVLKLFRPGLMKLMGGSYRTNQFDLVLHYLKMVFRGFAREKVHAMINVLGLAVGLAAAMVLFQYIDFELSYDRFHADAENIYRVTQSTFRSGSLQTNEPDTWSGLGGEAKGQLPDIEELVRIHPVSILNDVVVSNTENHQNFFESDILYADSGFFNLFQFPFLAGSAEHALEDIHSIVITEEVARKYFGSVDILGKTLRIYGGSLSGEFIVQGVLKDLPKNTHLEFDIIIPMEFLLTHYGQYVRSDQWAWTNFSIYLKVSPSVDIKTLERGFDQLVQNRLGDNLKQTNEEIKIGLQPITDIHLRSDLNSEYIGRNGDIRDVWIFGAVGIMILLIAWINYINLSTARAIRREKEVGIKKSMGANQKQLVGQFLFESLVVHCMAICLAILIIVLVNPIISDLTGTGISFKIFDNTSFYLILTLFLVAGSFISGLYPAFILARFRPVSMLKSVSIISQHLLRKGLISFQLLISMILIAGTYLVYQQVSFMKNRELGVDMEKILIVPGPRAVLEQGVGGNEQLSLSHRYFSNKLLQNTAVQGITGSSNIPSKGEIWTGPMRRLGDPRENNQVGAAVLVSFSFADVYELDFIAGAPFTEGMSDYEAVIINEKAVEVYGLRSPLEAIGQSIVMDGMDTLRVHGVIKDFHWNSLQAPIQPIIFGVVNDFNAYLSIRISTNSIGETLDYIEANFREIYPNDPFECYFLDQDFNAQYQSDVRFGQMIFVFSLIAIIIACIGLFAVISFTTTLKIKEIGIRKVLGAGVGDLMFLLSKEYLILLLLSVSIATPIIIIAGRNWLQHYAYNVGVTPDLILIPGSILLIISIVTVFQRIFSVANSNPVDSLRDE